MKLYFAGAHEKTYFEAFKRAGGRRILISYYYFNKESNTQKVVDEYKNGNLELFIDSGAYTAFTQGIEIKIEDYCNFLRRYNFPLYANLDDVKSWQNTLQNQKIMEAAGLNPLPVWHIFEPHQVLKDYVGSYPYVALGFGPSRSAPERAAVAASIFEEFPRTKFHMFAITQPELMIRHPFYSADSTTWLNGSKYGALLTPWNYILVGREKGKSKRHYLNMSRTEQIKWASYFRISGFDIQKMVDSGSTRADFAYKSEYVIKYFLSLEAAINATAPPAKSKKMLDSFFSIQRARKVIECLKRKLWKE